MRIITGCSRSGTSFVSQAIHHLGGDFGNGQDLIAGDEWNQKGYFENRVVNALNHRLLFGPWSNPRLWIDIMWPKNPWIHLRKLTTIAQGPAISHPALVKRRGARLRASIRSVGQSLAGKVVKDPRFSYLMDPWTATGSVHSVLYVLRHPWEAASSMSRQTKLPLTLTYLGWIDAVKKFWDHPPQTPVKIVDYNAFFDPDKCHREVRTLTGFLGCDHSPELADQILDRVLDKNLRTRQVTTGKLPKKVDALYQSVLERHDAQSMRSPD